MADDAAADFCPYVGLQPFTLRDREFFFGREREQRIIAANLFAAPLTILYGPSAVGKSSVLQAGVVPRLAAEPHTAILYFATWQGESYLAKLKNDCRAAIQSAHGKPIDVDDTLPLDEWIASARLQFHGTLLMMFDQFEEYLLYHGEARREIVRRRTGAHHQPARSARQYPHRAARRQPFEAESIQQAHSEPDGEHAAAAAADA